MDIYQKFYIFIFFFNDTATTEIYTLSLHDALPILLIRHLLQPFLATPLPHTIKEAVTNFSIRGLRFRCNPECLVCGDRKSTRLNSSHANISYAVFCLKKKKKKN